MIFTMRELIYTGLIFFNFSTHGVCVPKKVPCALYDLGNKKWILPCNSPPLVDASNGVSPISITGPDDHRNVWKTHSEANSG